MDGFSTAGKSVVSLRCQVGLVEDSVLLSYTPKVPDGDQKGIRSDTEVDNKRLLRS